MTGEIQAAVPRDVYFDDIVVGARFRTASRIVAAQDIQDFCRVTGDHHPLHTDPAYARGKGFPDIIAHGLFCLSIMEGLKTQTGLYENTSIASLGWDAVKFVAPVIAGDEVHVEFAFAAKRLAAKPGRGVVSETVLLINQHNQIVVSATHAALVITRGSAP
jgi:acyl dehydratase